MGLENRDYLRDDNFSRYSSYGSGTTAPMCRLLLILTVVVFLLQVISKGQQGSVVQNWLQLETEKVLHGQVWRLLTCAFCHDSERILHILFNMLFLWWFGQTLESMYGSREFLLFYLTAAVAASIAFVGLDLVIGNPKPMIGASGAVMAVTMLFALHYPTQKILLFFIVPVEIRWVVLMYVVFDLYPVFQELSGRGAHDNIAHAAHLGGLAFGYVYGKSRLRFEPYWASLQSLLSRLPSRRRPKLRVVHPAPPNPEIDAILQKIHDSGEESLTDAERRTLEEASQRLRNRRRS